MAYTYTDLTVKLKIDPVWLADASSVFVAIQPQNAKQWKWKQRTSAQNLA